jgi:2-oxoglutarate ferredoxin oxidoreductase subunit alpha
MGVSLMEGNEAIAWGAYDAGCKFFAGYPITPATSIYSTMLKLLPPENGVVMQGEDEIASMGLCLGASMAGLKVMTATSGPGISLYSEHISFAIGSEIPLVIVDVQRLGPSTGSATRGADGDVQFLRWSNTGGLPIICLAPTDVKDCYQLTMEAFNLAEKYRCPVFIASNKEIGLTRESVDIDSLERPALIERIYAPEGEEYLPFKPMPGSDVPYFRAIGGKEISRQTSSTHGLNGYITTDPDEIKAQIDRMERKLQANVNEFSMHESYLTDDAETIILTYGVTARAARAARKILEAKGTKVSLGILKTLWPLPVDLIKELTGSLKRVIVAEMNNGQYVREIERILPDKQVELCGYMNGKLITPEEIVAAVERRGE